MCELGTLVESCELGLGHPNAIDHRIGMREEDCARRRQCDGAGAARPVDQALAGEALQRRDLMADRRLHVPKSKCGTPEGAFLRDRAQRNEVSELHT